MVTLISAGEDGSVRLQWTSSRSGLRVQVMELGAVPILRISPPSTGDRMCCLCMAWQGLFLAVQSSEPCSGTVYIHVLPSKSCLQALVDAKRCACREEGARGVLESRLSVLEDEIQQVQHCNMHAHVPKRRLHINCAWLNFFHLVGGS